jgi:hypothetical protein
MWRGRSRPSLSPLDQMRGLGLRRMPRPGLHSLARPGGHAPRDGVALFWWCPQCSPFFCGPGPGDISTCGATLGSHWALSVLDRGYLASAQLPHGTLHSPAPDRPGAPDAGCSYRRLRCLGWGKAKSRSPARRELWELRPHDRSRCAEHGGLARVCASHRG